MYKYIHTCIYIHTYMSAHLHTYTYIHTHIQNVHMNARKHAWNDSAAAIARGVVVERGSFARLFRSTQSHHISHLQCKDFIVPFVDKIVLCDTRWRVALGKMYVVECMRMFPVIDLWKLHSGNFLYSHHYFEADQAQSAIPCVKSAGPTLERKGSPNERCLHVPSTLCVCVYVCM